MVKQKSSAHSDRNMKEYKMRTPYNASKNNYRQNPSKPNRVQVAHSNGSCCSSSRQTTQNIPSQPVTIQSQTPRETAHDRSHSRLNPPDPYYYRQINKNPNRNKKPYFQQAGKNKIHSTGSTTYAQQSNPKPHPVQQSTSTNKSSCCTIQ
jgi:hypothetical protein